jgi:hypothetical protein
MIRQSGGVHSNQAAAGKADGRGFLLSSILPLTSPIFSFCSLLRGFIGPTPGELLSSLADPSIPIIILSQQRLRRAPPFRH